MICNICGTKEATIHLTEIINGKMTEVHICENCAEEKGTEFKTYFNFQDFVLAASGEQALGKSAPRKSAIVCKTCKMAYQEFVKNGRLGCADCYSSFRKPLELLIKQVQRSDYHEGKRPSQTKKEKQSSYSLKQLQEKLRKSIQEEAFEEAAKIRDQLKLAEEKLQKKKEDEK